MLLRRDLLFAFQDFAKTLAVTCNFSTKVVANPIQVINNNHNKNNNILFKRITLLFY